MKILLASLLITLLSYSRILKGFFLQDEWLGFSRYILRSDLNFDGLLNYFFAPSVTHYAPLTTIILYTNLSIFGMNFTAHAIISLLLHIIAVILVFVLIKKIFSSEFLAGIGTLLFASFSSIQQATSWVMADIGTHGATIFGILSMIFFLDFLKNKINSKLYYSLLFLFISLMFKEITIGLFFIMLLLLWNDFGVKNIQKRKSFKLVGLFCLFYLVFRIAMIPLVAVQLGDAGLVFESQNNVKIFYDFLTIPIKAISQSIVPIEVLRGVAEYIARLFPRTITSEINSPAFEVFVVEKVLEFISLSTSLIIGILVLLKKNRTRTILLGFIWILTNSFIFAFSPQRTGVTSVIDSRNLYFVSIGATLMLTTLFEKIQRKNKIVSIIFLAIILFSNLFYLNRNLSNFVKVGSDRREILNQITRTIPKLPQKVVIYTQSSQSYYGLSEEKKIMPFQSGFGQTLLVWYYHRSKFPTSFFEDRFLWEIESQGYREADGVGFGYFRDLDLLKEVVKQYNLPKESVIGFYWDSKKETVSDISEEVRTKTYD